MTQLDPRFMRIEHRSVESRIIGAYLQPKVKFAERTDIDTTPGHLAQIVHTVEIDGLVLLVTRMGGVFVSPPANLLPFWDPGELGPSTQYREKVDYQRRFADAANLLVAELAMHGIPLDPLSPLAQSTGEMYGSQAMIMGGSGTVGMRNLEVGRALLRPDPMLWTDTGINVTASDFGAVAPLARAGKLRQVSPTLPTFLAAAYAFMRDGQEGEALMDAWIVAEQVVNLLWSDWIRGTDASSHIRGELRKDRVVQRRLNLLEACGQLDGELATKLRTAAEHRNKVVHRSTIPPGAADAVFDAMLLLLRKQLGDSGISGASHRAGGISW